MLLVTGWFGKVLGCSGFMGDSADKGLGMSFLKNFCLMDMSSKFLTSDNTENVFKVSAVVVGICSMV